MDIIDKFFVSLPWKKKAYIALISLGFLAVAVVGFVFRIMTIFEAFLIFIAGTLYANMMKMQLRIEVLEEKIDKKIK